MTLEPVPVARHGRIPPHSLEAEESVLGAMLLSRDAIATCLELEVGADDFYKPQHGATYAALVAMYERGIPVDPVTVTTEATADELDQIGGRGALLRLQASVPASANARHYARTIIETAGKRRLIWVAGEIADAGYAETTAFPAAYEQAVDLVLDAERATDDLPAPTVDEFLAEQSDEYRWVIPGVIEEYERIIVVAGEGLGKTTILRQVAVAASQGLHPFRPGLIEPVRVLLIDLENPPVLIRRQLRRCLDAARPEAAADLFDPSRLRVIVKPEGVDVTRARDARWLLNQVRVNRPQLICLGPLYQLHESEEEKSQDVKKVIRLLNRVRNIAGAGLLMESHAPHESFKRDGELRVAGSRLWTRWPDRVLGLYSRGPDGKALPVDWRRISDTRPPRFHRPRGNRDGWPGIVELGRPDAWPWVRAT